MLKLTEPILDQIAQVIVQEINPERIILFGSQAQGKTSENSDLDLLIVEKESFSPKHSRRKEIAKIRKALSTFRISKDILVYTSDEVAKWRNSVNHIIPRCLQEGKVLYERP